MTQSEQIRENRAFMEMMKAAREWLADRDPIDIAKKAGIDFDGETMRFSFRSLGTEICVHYPDYKIEPYINEWQQLVILHYMRLADGMPLQGQWMTWISLLCRQQNAEEMQMLM